MQKLLNVITVRNKFYFLPILFIICFSNFSESSAQEKYISFQKTKGSLGLAVSGKALPIYISSDDYSGVAFAAKDLQSDIARVTNTQPLLLTDKPSAKEVVVIGTIGKNTWIDELISQKKIVVTHIVNKWETFLIQVVEHPFPGVDRALVIAGSDKRGTIYGIYDLSAQIGVSPWYWWADVPVKKQNSIYILSGAHTQGEPAVKYRGIFINDEAPALSGWAYEKFGGYNHKFYEKVFELMLRLKANYLWPAMWGNAFNEDDTLNRPLANEYGIVMGTSHHQPMLRAQQEWRNHGTGQWNYTNNETVLKEFWKQGIRNMRSNESIITIAMRGEGDEPMSEESNIALLERIVKDQREILKDVTGKDPASIPQVWVIYKEVQDYYDKGMRVPDDVTLLFCDDNWGNIRKLPKPTDKPRAGGYGVYYHYDYVGGPRNYKWLNTNPLPRIWEQMHLAYQAKANQMWIVNVGDVKPMEFSMSFFFDYAWNPNRIQANQLNTYTTQWIVDQFGTEHATAIANILSKYLKYNARRKPELLSPETYSLINYLEAETVVSDYNKLVEGAEKIYTKLSAAYKDAYYQLVLHPVKACANLNELYVTAARNKLYVSQGRASANELAKQVKILFKKDSSLSYFYNKIMAGGKWNHMMDQTHIGYTNWQQPDVNNSPEVKSINVPFSSDMGVAIEGSERWWPKETSDPVLQEFTPVQQRSPYFEIFNRGQTSFDYTIKVDVPWLTINYSKGKIEKEQRFWLTVDWKQVPKNKLRVPITITGPDNNHLTLYAVINNALSLKDVNTSCFVESNGYISIEAEHYTKAIENDSIKWQLIPDLGRTGSGITSYPTHATKYGKTASRPCLEYRVHFIDTGKFIVNTYFSPTLDFLNKGGLKYGISFDDEPPQIINVHANETNQSWEKSVRDNIRILSSKHKITIAGDHTLKFWIVDTGLVLQKIVIDTGGVKPSYLGPPESYRMLR